MTGKMGILLIGGGGHCKAAIDVIEAAAQFSVRGIVERAGSETRDVLGYPVVGTDDDLAELLGQDTKALVTIGQITSPRPRRSAFEQARNAGADMAVVVSPHAHVSRHATVSAGTLVMHGVIVNSAARVGQNCILNSLSLVEHDAEVGDHCHVSTGARINGACQVGEGTFIGSGAVLKNGVQLGPGCIVGAGSYVAADLPARTLVRSPA